MCIRDRSKGDIIVTGIRQQQTAMRGSLFDEFFRDTMTDVSPMGELKLAVVATKPAGVVKVTEITAVSYTHLDVYKRQDYKGAVRLKVKTVEEMKKDRKV